MGTFRAEDFLLVRDLGYRRDAVDRAVGMLARVHPGTDPAALPLGRRNTALLDLREDLFGPEIAAFAVCPHCSEELELSLTVDALRSGHSPEQTNVETALEIDGIRFRLLDSSDLKAAAACEDVETARALLLERCAGTADLPDDVIERIGAAMEASDPQAETLLDVACAACGRPWQLTFDIVSFLHAEVDAQARRLLREIHTLARGYGWSEREILALSARRRRDYLELLAQ
jgi:hypothetical protein